MILQLLYLKDFADLNAFEMFIKPFNPGLLWKKSLVFFSLQKIKQEMADLCS